MKHKRQYPSRRRFLANATTVASAAALPSKAASSHSQNRSAIIESPDSAAAWVEFQQRLAAVLPALKEDEYLIVELKHTNQYVQFAAQGHHGMRVEVVSNAFLADNLQLSATESARLTQMGWHSPTTAPRQSDDEEEAPDGSPNYYIDAAAPVPYDRLAELAVRTLRDVYRVGHPGNLQYVGASFVGQFASIRFPTLGLKEGIK